MLSKLQHTCRALQTNRLASDHRSATLAAMPARPSIHVSAAASFTGWRAPLRPPHTDPCGCSHCCHLSSHPGQGLSSPGLCQTLLTLSDVCRRAGWRRPTCARGPVMTSGQCTSQPPSSLAQARWWPPTMTRWASTGHRAAAQSTSTLGTPCKHRSSMLLSWAQGQGNLAICNGTGRLCPYTLKHVLDSPRSAPVV